MAGSSLRAGEARAQGCTTFVLWRELQFDFAFRRMGLAAVISLFGRLKAKKREDLKVLHELELVRHDRAHPICSCVELGWRESLGSPQLIHGTVCCRCNCAIYFHFHWPQLACCHRCHGGRSHTQGREVLHELVRREPVVARFAVALVLGLAAVNSLSGRLKAKKRGGWQDWARKRNRNRMKRPGMLILLPCNLF